MRSPVGSACEPPPRASALACTASVISFDVLEVSRSTAGGRDQWVVERVLEGANSRTAPAVSASAYRLSGGRRLTRRAQVRTCGTFRGRNALPRESGYCRGHYRYGRAVPPGSRPNHTVQRSFLRHVRRRESTPSQSARRRNAIAVAYSDNEPMSQTQAQL